MPQFEKPQPAEIHGHGAAHSRKGEKQIPPGNIICCLVDYKLKEEILRKDRNRIQLSHGGADTHIYQHLSSITLQHRRDKKPLLDTLHSKGIHYRWKFPVCLSTSTQGHTALLKVSEDLHLFCNTLSIPGDRRP